MNVSHGQIVNSQTPDITQMEHQDIGIGHLIASEEACA